MVTKLFDRSVNVVCAYSIQVSWVWLLICVSVFVSRLFCCFIHMAAYRPPCTSSSSCLNRRGNKKKERGEWWGETIKSLQRVRKGVSKVISSDQNCLLDGWTVSETPSLPHTFLRAELGGGYNCNFSKRTTWHYATFMSCQSYRYYKFLTPK